MTMQIDQEMFRAQLKQEKAILRDKSVAPEVLAKLPKDAKVLAKVITENMDGEDQEAILVLFRDEMSGMIRVAHFASDTGEYMDDYIV